MTKRERGSREGRERQVKPKVGSHETHSISSVEMVKERRKWTLNANNTAILPRERAGEIIMNE